MKACVACQESIPNNAKFCRHCGHVVGGPPPFTQPVTSPPPTAAPPLRPKTAGASKKSMPAVAWVAIGCGVAMFLVAVLGIFAAIAIPKFASMLEKSREGATLGNLAAIQSAVLIYQDDHQGRPPKAIDQAPFIGEYMDFLPTVKVTGNNENNPHPFQIEHPDSNRVVAKRDNKGGWYYSPRKGEVRVNLDGLDSRGREYWNYGRE